jgi:hypothetical protein
VKDQQVGDEVVVFDELALLVPDAFGGKCAAPESYPLNELIKAFALVCGGLDGSPQLNIG